MSAEIGRVKVARRVICDRCMKRAATVIVAEGRRLRRHVCKGCRKRDDVLLARMER